MKEKYIHIQKHTVSNRHIAKYRATTEDTVTAKASLQLMT